MTKVSSYKKTQMNSVINRFFFFNEKIVFVVVAMMMMMMSALYVRYVSHYQVEVVMGWLNRQSQYNHHHHHTTYEPCSNMECLDHTEQT